MGNEQDGMTLNLGDAYGPELLRQADRLWSVYIRDAGPASSYSKVKEALRDEIVKPRLEHINMLTGQENDADFLAYQLIFVFQRLYP